VTGHLVDPSRGVYANRTLNLRSIRAVGYDMDYTLVHYDPAAWEAAAFDHAVALLADRGWPTDQLRFDPLSHVQGLIIDLHLGNLAKPTRFGYVIRAAHGTRQLGFDELRRAYAGTFVDLAERRWAFLNTLFSLSEASLYAQLVDLADDGRLPGVLGYDDIHAVVREVLAESHTQGALKAQIIADPARFVVPDPDLAAALEDQRAAGKTLLLVTNSEWPYVAAMMTFTLGEQWRSLFDLIVVEARKPAFFSSRQACYRLVDPDRNLLEPHRGPLHAGEVYVGADASLVEATLGVSGADVLYVGDHIFGDVHASKATLRWRTCLILRELEEEIAAQAGFATTEIELRTLMAAKGEAERHVAHLRMARARSGRRGEGGQLAAAVRTSATLDERIAPLAQAAGVLGNPTWGLLLRAGNDKSLFAHQVERSADIYTSRVANLGLETPYAYLRAARPSLPHDL
jgi:HAD superfamily 5'-nucleotidase-like hydrolase